jgi:hypothetical protein
MEACNVKLGTKDAARRTACIEAMLCAAALAEVIYGPCLYQS